MSDAAMADAAATDPLVTRYLEHVRFEKRLAERTCTLYQLDLIRLAKMSAASQVPLLQVQTAHIRRWVAQMHSAGRSGRGIALILSGWRGFYNWLGREGLIPHNPVADVRAPRVAKPLPKALGVDEAVQLAEHEEDNDDPWLEARDAAMVELLYGCGLRIAELTGLDVVASTEAARAGRGWIDIPNAEVQVQGKGNKRRTVPLGRAAMEALTHWLAVRPQLTGMLTQPAKGASPLALALFPGRHGTRLTPARCGAAPQAPQPAGGLGHPGAPAHAAPLLCQPCVAIEWRLAGRARAAGPRQHQHHPGLHAAGFSAPGQNLRRGPSPCQAQMNPVARAAHVP
jgi:integrase/recombinase XerC